MVTATTVVCWIIGLGGILGFISAGFMSTFLAGPYMIMSILIVVAAMYFNIKYKQIDREKRFQIVLIRKLGLIYSDSVDAKVDSEPK